MWIDFDFEGLAFVDFLEVVDDYVLLFFFDFGVLESWGLLAVVFFGFGLRAESNEGWMVVMRVALSGEELGDSVDLMREAVFGDWDMIVVWNFV